MAITKQDIERALSVIGWKLRFCGCDTYNFIDNLGNIQRLQLEHNRIIYNHNFPEDTFRAYWYLRDLQVVPFKMPDESPVTAISFSGVSDESIFLTCHKWDSA